MKKSSKRSIYEDKKLVKFLADVKLFEKLSGNERKNMGHYIYLRKFKSGEQIFKKDYPNVVFYIIKEGELKVYLEKEGKEIEINRLKPKDYIGEIGLFLEENRAASAIAVQDSILLAISKKDLKKFIDRFPRAGIKIMYQLGEILSNYIIVCNEKLQISEKERI